MLWQQTESSWHQQNQETPTSGRLTVLGDTYITEWFIILLTKDFTYYPCSRRDQSRKQKMENDFFWSRIVVSVTVCLHNALQPCRSRCGLIVETSPRCILLHPHFYIWSTCHTACSNVPVREELSYIWWWSKLKVISSDFFFFGKIFHLFTKCKCEDAIYNSRAALMWKEVLKSVYPHLWY